MSSGSRSLPGSAAPPSVDPFGRDAHAPQRYAPSDYSPSDFGQDGDAPGEYLRDNYDRAGYDPDGYDPDAFTPGAYPSGGYGARSYPAEPYRDPHGESRGDPHREDLWSYDRDHADPYLPAGGGSAGSPAGSPAGVDDPLGLGRPTAAPRPPMTPPPDYHRSQPSRAASPRVPRDSDEGYTACPNCHSPHEVGARFCEVCGFDLVLMEHPGPPEPVPVQTSWDVVVEAEREYYDSGDDHRVPFPSAYPRRVFALSGPRLLIGRRSESRGIHPEIDLSGAPEDPGISRAHAMLELMPDGGYAVLDPGSTNGTRINDEPNPIPRDQQVALRNGDRVYLGAWTRVTIRSR